MRPIVNSIKHYVQNSLFTIASGAVSNRIIIDAVRVAAASGVSEVVEGSVIKAVYLEFWVITDDAASGTVITTLEKIPADAGSPTAADMASLDGYTNKKNIFYTQMGLISPNVQYPTNVIKGWFKIPKGKQRFGLGDELRLNILAQSNGISACGFATFKEYS